MAKCGVRWGGRLSGILLPERRLRDPRLGKRQVFQGGPESRRSTKAEPLLFRTQTPHLPAGGVMLLAAMLLGIPSPHPGEENL